MPVIVSHAGGCVPVGVLCFFLEFTTQHTVCAHIVCWFFYHTQHNTPCVRTVCHTFDKPVAGCQTQCLKSESVGCLNTV